MTKKDVPFMWQPEQQQAFQELKQVITEAPVLPYHKPGKENFIPSDASFIYIYIYNHISNCGQLFRPFGADQHSVANGGAAHPDIYMKTS